MHDEEIESMWIGSYINCSRQRVEVTESICTPSLLDVIFTSAWWSCIEVTHYYGDASFWLDIAFIKTSKLLRNFSNSSLDWLGERYKVAIKHFLFL